MYVCPNDSFSQVAEIIQTDDKFMPWIDLEDEFYHFPLSTKASNYF